MLVIPLPQEVAAQETLYLEEWYAGKGSQEAASLDRVLSVTDISSNLYVAGSTINQYGKYDLTLTKYNSSGQVQWSSTYNVASNDGNVLVGDLALDNSLNILVTGSVYKDSINHYDVFTVKFNSSGTKQWDKLYNGSASYYDGGVALAIDGFSNIYVSGGATNSGNSVDMVCIKYHSNGTQLWAQNIDSGNHLYDAGAILVLTGGAFGTYIEIKGVLQQSLTEWSVGSVLLHRTSGTVSSSITVSEEAEMDEIVDMAVDDANNLYISGYEDTGSNGLDFITIKLDESLEVVWEKIYDGNAHEDDRPRAITLDDSGNVYVAGYTTTTTGKDYTVVKYNASGSEQWVSLYDGDASTDDEAYDLLADSTGYIYVTGYATQHDSKDYFTRILSASSGTAIWSNGFNGLENRDDWATEIQLDGTNGFIVLGKNGKVDGGTDYMTVSYAKKTVVIPPDEEATSAAISFIENRGQLTDTSGTAVTTVKYYATGSYPPLYIQQNKFSYVLSRIDTISSTPDTLHRVDVSFKNGKTPDMRAYGLEERDWHYNYYLGHVPEGRARVAAHERVIQSDIYNYIDLQYYSNQSNTKYYFTIQPGGDPDDIVLEFAGHDSLSIDGNGDLVVGTSLGSFKLPAPEAYQVNSVGQAVATTWSPAFSLSGSEVSFSATGSFDTTKTLVIVVKGEITVRADDDWITYFGGISTDEITGSDLDNEGSFYISGTSTSVEFPNITGIMTEGTLGFSSAFIGKFKNDAALQYFTLLGGGFLENGYDVKVLDKVYLVGRSLSSNFPATSGTPTPAIQGFVASFTLNGGTLLAAKILDSSGGGESKINCLVIDQSGVYIAGETNNFGAGFSMQQNNGWNYFDGSQNGGIDGIILKLNPDLETIWSTYFGGFDDDRIVDLEKGQNGNLFIAGNTATDVYSNNTCNVPQDNNFPNCKPTGSSQYNFADGASSYFGQDVFLAEFDIQGSLAWSTFFGGDLEDIILSPSSISLSGNKLALMGGSDKLRTVPANTGGGYQQDIENEGYFIAEFTNRSLTWKTSFGCIEGSSFSFTQSVDYGLQDILFASGNTTCASPVSSNNYCMPPNSSGLFPLCPPLGNSYFEDTFAGGRDLFLAAFSSDRSLVYSTYFGGNSHESVWSLHSKGDAIFFNGSTSSNDDFPLSFPAGAYQQDFNAGENDGFIAKLNTSNLVAISEVNTEDINISLYPNPTTEKLMIESPHLQQSTDFSATIYDINGKIVKRIQFNDSNQTWEADVSDLPGGIYQILIKHIPIRFIKI
ncbi:MAG TPA: SBBP repeat-containing protein [Saprospiraceae bacterium]|nr:SBBP repeat-containing protein [Saprospiraceae bacterium]HMQ83372.1 SBBP repeat-containing protein [Saprospiraceae bacterium]